MAGFEDDDLLSEMTLDGSVEVEPDADLRTEEPPEGQQLTRDGKKRARYDDLLKESEALKSELAELKQKFEAQPWQQFAPPPQHSQQPNPELAYLEQRMNQNRTRREELEQLFAAEERAGMSQERRKQLRDQYEELNAELVELRVEARQVRTRPSPEQLTQAQQWQALQARYPDIMGDRRAYQLASSLVGQEQALNPQKVFTSEDWDRIADETRIKLGKKAPPVSDATKARYSGHGAGGNGAEGGPSFPQRLSKDDVRLALSVYRDVVASQGEKAALAKYWREIKEPELREQAQARRHSS